jgi:hypothetical protein
MAPGVLVRQFPHRSTAARLTMVGGRRGTRGYRARPISSPS